jgi:hypothetical protein
MFNNNQKAMSGFLFIKYITGKRAAKNIVRYAMYAINLRYEYFIVYKTIYHFHKSINLAKE